MCDVDDYDGNFDVDDQAWITARKAAQCSACGEAIRPGDRYYRTKTLYDGRWDLFRHCARCRFIVEALFAAGAEAIDYNLACGARWTDNFRKVPEPVELAVMTRDEAQAALAGRGGSVA